MDPKQNFFVSKEQSKFIHRVYQETPQIIRKHFEEELLWLRQALAGSKRVLEIGCGTGRAVPALDPGMNYYGMDIGYTSLLEAREQHPHLCWFCADAVHLPVFDSCIDAAFCVQNTIGNMEGVEQLVIAEAQRILHKDGKFILSAYTEDSLELRRLWYDRLVDCGIFGRVWVDPANPRIVRSDTGWSSRCFTKDELEQLVGEFATDVIIRKLDSFLYFCVVCY